MEDYSCLDGRDAETFSMNWWDTESITLLITQLFTHPESRHGTYVI